MEITGNKSYYNTGVIEKLEQHIYTLLCHYVQASGISISSKKIKSLIHQFILINIQEKNSRKSWNGFIQSKKINSLKYPSKVDLFLEIIFKLVDTIRRHESIHPRIDFDAPESVYLYFYHLSTLDREMMKAVYLKNHEHLQTKDLFLGGNNLIFMTPREVLAPAIKLDADQMILIHNHPTGNTQPSDKDFEFTRKINLLSTKLGIKLLDHLIIGMGYFSFKQEGLL